MAEVQPSDVDHLHRNSPFVDTPKEARVVVMRGEHDMSTTAALTRLFSTVIALDDADIVVDASEVTFLDASTLGVLVRARDYLLEHSRSLHIRSPSACVRRIVTLCNLASFIEDTDDPIVANEPVESEALETWVAIPATTPVHRPPMSPPDAPIPHDGSTNVDLHRRTPPLALIGVSAAPSAGGDTNPTIGGEANPARSAP